MLLHSDNKFLYYPVDFLISDIVCIFVCVWVCVCQLDFYSQNMDNFNKNIVQLGRCLLL